MENTAYDGSQVSVIQPHPAVPPQSAYPHAAPGGVAAAAGPYPHAGPIGVAVPGAAYPHGAPMGGGYPAPMEYEQYPGYGSPHGMSMQQMPHQVVWMPKPQAASGVPPGLEYLTQIDQLLVKQKVELLEVYTGYEMNNKYSIRNVMGQQIYFAKEDTDFCVRNCCGPQRPFVIHIEDNMGQEVIQLIRPYRCMCYGHCFSCSACCQDEVEVQAPVGKTVGFVKQLYEGCEIRYALQDPERNTVMRVHGPNYCACYCPGDDIPFRLMSADQTTEIGKVSKQWSNLFKEWFTDADNFGIQFPLDLEVCMKAVVLGAVFLIDFMFFERSSRRRRF